MYVCVIKEVHKQIYTVDTIALVTPRPRITNYIAILIPRSSFNATLPTVTI